MSMQTGITVMAALAPFVGVWALMELVRRIGLRREARIHRQIALTDAIHRELGAAAAPVVHRSWSREWIVLVRVPLHREDLVGAITRITHDLFHRLDGQEPLRLRIVLIPREARPQLRPVPTVSTRTADRLSRAA